MKRNRLATIFVCVGIAMVISAFGLVGYNFYESKQAEVISQEVLQQIINEMPEAPEKAVVNVEFDYSEALTVQENKSNQSINIPTTTIYNIEYIGYIEIPSLGLSLPVINTSNQTNLNIAPCRFYGSAYLDNMVIGAHNFSSHFGRIGSLNFGDSVIFTDVEGKVFEYEVADIEILQPHQSEYLCNSEWSLSLYTCTISGRERVTVRCERVED